MIYIYFTLLALDKSWADMLTCPPLRTWAIMSHYVLSVVSTSNVWLFIIRICLTVCYHLWFQNVISNYTSNESYIICFLLCVIYPQDVCELGFLKFLSFSALSSDYTLLSPPSAGYDDNEHPAARLLWSDDCRFWEMWNHPLIALVPRPTLIRGGSIC